MKKTKTFGIILAMALMLIGIAGLTNATTTTNIPGEAGEVWQLNMSIISPNASDANTLGTFKFNVTVEHNQTETTITQDANLTLTISVTASSFCNESDLPMLLVNVTNTSAGVRGDGAQVTFGASVDTTTLQDCPDYTLVATLINETVDGAVANMVTLGQDTLTSVLIQNTVPITPVIEHPAEKQIIENRTMVLKAAIGSNNVTQCTFYFKGPNPGSSSYTVKDSNNDYCNVSIEKASENTFTIYATATDETDTSAQSGDRLFSIDTGGKGGAAAYHTYEQQKQLQEAAAQPAPAKDQQTTLLLLAAIVVIIFIINKKSGK